MTARRTSTGRLMRAAVERESGGVFNCQRDELSALFRLAFEHGDLVVWRAPHQPVWICFARSFAEHLDDLTDE